MSTIALLRYNPAPYRTSPHFCSSNFTIPHLSPPFSPTPLHYLHYPLWDCIEQSNAIQCNPIGGNGADPDNLLALAVIAARARASLGEISMALEAEWGRHVATTQVVQGHGHPSAVHYSTLQGITAPLDLVSHTLPPSFVPSLSPPIPCLTSSPLATVTPPLRCVQIIHERRLGEGRIQQCVGGSEGILRSSWPETPYPCGQDGTRW